MKREVWTVLIVLVSLISVSFVIAATTSITPEEFNKIDDPLANPSTSTPSTPIVTPELTPTTTSTTVVYYRIDGSQLKNVANLNTLADPTSPNYRGTGNIASTLYTGTPPIANPGAAPALQVVSTNLRDQTILDALKQGKTILIPVQKDGAGNGLNSILNDMNKYGVTDTNGDPVAPIVVKKVGGGQIYQSAGSLTVDPGMEGMTNPVGVSSMPYSDFLEGGEWNTDPEVNAEYKTELGEGTAAKSNVMGPTASTTGGSAEGTNSFGDGDDYPAGATCVFAS